MTNTVIIPGSKSETVRAIILSSILGGKIFDANICDDSIAALNIAKALGAKIKYEDAIIIEPSDEKAIKADVLDSASVFKMGILSMLAIQNEAEILFSRQLASRDKGKLWDFLESNGVIYKFSDSSIYLKGNMDKDYFEIYDDNSSQLLSAIIISIALKRSKGEVHYKNIPSFRYVLLTLEILKAFNIKSTIENDIINIDARYAKACEIHINSDASALAPFLSARALGYKFNVKFNIDKTQVDSVFIEILCKMGYCNENLEFEHSKSLYPVDIDCDSFPDIVPFIALVATQIPYKSTLRNLYRLKNKECDRFNTTVDILSKLGANIVVQDNDMIIYGKREKWNGNINIDTKKDHRMVMLAAIASLNCKEKNKISDCDSVNKSFPSFWNEYKKIGGKYECME